MEDKANSIINQRNIKARLFFSILIIIFSISLVEKTFQNDTFFNISIGKYIIENGIDMKDHFSWIKGLDYTYSHWAFDIIMYLIYNSFNFTGIYVGTIILTCIINVILFNLIATRTKRPVISAAITFCVSSLIGTSYTARSQIVSFLCFIIEIYCIEQYIDTNKIKYAISILILSVIVANFHAATWPLTLVLFLPYLVPAFLNLTSSKKYGQKLYTKIERRESYNGRNLLFLFIVTCFTGLITPIHNVPYTYILKSMFGKSNIEGHLSIDYIAEMEHLMPIINLKFVIFTILFLSFLIFLPTKIKSEHGFLMLGLYFMALSSNRYVILLDLIGAFVIADLMTQGVNMFIPEEMDFLDKACTKNYIMLLLIILTVAYSACNLIDISHQPYVDEKEYPVGATEYVLENIDYKNMKIYNHYDTGSYLMLNNIDVFIDSRLDVYCSEFSNVDIFKDFLNLESGKLHYKDFVEKYHNTHFLIKNDNLLHTYIDTDQNYKKMYEDEYFSLYKVNEVAN